MSESITFRYEIPGDDFTRAGEASSDIKNKLKMMGVSNTVVRKVAIAMYEGESIWSSMPMEASSLWRSATIILRSS